MLLYYDNFYGTNSRRVSTTRDSVNRILRDILRIFLRLFNRDEGTYTGTRRRIRDSIYNAVPRFRRGQELSTKYFRRVLRLFVLSTTKGLNGTIGFRYYTTYSLTGSFNKSLGTTTPGVYVLGVRYIILRSGTNATYFFLFRVILPRAVGTVHEAASFFVSEIVVPSGQIQFRCLFQGALPRLLV